MSVKEEVEDFYDSYVGNQTKIGVSIRHRQIFKNLKSIGLKKDSKVLEIGCGIGTVSGLIISAIPDGHFLGCDISPKSIELAGKFNPQKNAKFLVTDMSDFQYDQKFDFVVFPDVLEHIPVEQHSNLFKNVAAACKPNAKVLINIPEPNSLDWTRKYTPEKLQIIDQSLSMQELLNNTYPHGFYVQSIEPYSIHTNVPNYLKIILVRNPGVSDLHYNTKLSKLIQNIKVRFF